MPRPNALRSLVGGLFVGAALLAMIVVGGWKLARRTQERSVQNAAAPHLGCPAASVRVTALPSGDIEEAYSVEGCGKRGRLLCAPQDPSCGFMPE